MLAYNWLNCASFCLELAGMLILEQHGPTTFDLRAILQKRDNSWDSSKNMMYETTDLQHSKLNKGRSVSVSLKLLHNSKY